jgi:hypothetical protein
MDTLLHLIKDRQIGTCCKIGAWIVAVLCLVEVGLQVRSVALQNSGLNGALSSVTLLQVLPFVLSILTSSLFFFFILYAAGVAIDRLVLLTNGNDQDEEEENEMMDDEDDETVMPGQMR